jgi:biotin transport system substrate-specific component
MNSVARTLRTTVFGPRPLGETTTGIFGRHLLVIAALAALTWIGAYVRIPLEPVPITLQTLFVLLAGALAGPGRGSVSQGVYVAAGLFGLPLFAGAVSGLAVIAGPTGGYLAGFVVSPIVVGWLLPRRKGFGWSLFVFAVGSMVTLALGVAHLAIFFTHDLWTAARWGLLPFLAGDAAKSFAAASIYSSYKKLHSPRRIG